MAQATHFVALNAHSKGFVATGATLVFIKLLYALSAFTILSTIVSLPDTQFSLYVLKAFPAFSQMSLPTETVLSTALFT